MKRNMYVSALLVGGLCSAALADVASTPFAVEVVSYDAGSNAAFGYTNPLAALGGITRFTSPDSIWGGPVGPFSPAWGTDEIVSVGAGGHLTLRFDRAITDSPDNLFGIDLIIFSNAGFILDFDGTTGSNPTLFGVGGDATVQLSADGISWTTVTTVSLGLAPTMGYADLTDPFATQAGNVLTDFTRAVDPMLGLGSFAGLDVAGIAALYDGSGGGIGIDIAGSGLASASFLRLVNNSDERFEIDGVSVVPAPGAFMLMLSAGVFATCRRRRG